MFTFYINNITSKFSTKLELDSNEVIKSWAYIVIWNGKCQKYGCTILPHHSDRMMIVCKTFCPWRRGTRWCLYCRKCNIIIQPNFSHGKFLQTVLHAPFIPSFSNVPYLNNGCGIDKKYIIRWTKCKWKL